MNEIKLIVDDKNLAVVTTILNNLQDGLINNIEVNGKSSTQRTSQYKARTNTIIREEESGTNDKTGKYANPATYKNRLKKK